MPLDNGGVLTGNGKGVVAYHDLQLALDAGYWASLREDGREAVHFAVLKEPGGKRAIQSFVAPFIHSWRFRHPRVSPTMIVLGIDREMAEKGLAVPHCARVMRRMMDAASRKGLITHSQLFYSTEDDSNPIAPGLNNELAMPASFIPFGVLGVAYAQART